MIDSSVVMDIKSYKQIYTLRVNQIDSKTLDNELIDIIESKLFNIESDWFSSLRPEVMAVIKIYIWINTVQRTGVSIGQSLFQLKYYNLNSDNNIRDNLNQYQRYGIILIQILFPWVKQRINRENMKNMLEKTENVYKSLDFLNSLIFLYYGKYRSLWERLLRLGTGMQSVRQNWSSGGLYLEIMNRELLWHTFAQLLTFVLPLINFYRLKNSYLNVIRRVFPSDVKTEESNAMKRKLDDLKTCIICNEWPINAHEIGCRHVFCYYCLMSRFLSDEIHGFSCDICFHKIKSIDLLDSLVMTSYPP
ncbi:peroxisome biogenesis factor 2-like [Oppia nitens]|uniref:peroxisome biogenesis factor 2-like n=1 Tax=Oppia nitens TaxID=1686743 RepID=UPI0023D99E0B|nr:peroxisome biogenesis factor 2-like [Oppia nitens]